MHILLYYALTGQEFAQTRLSFLCLDVFGALTNVLAYDKIRQPTILVQPEGDLTARPAYHSIITPHKSNSWQCSLTVWPTVRDG